MLVEKQNIYVYRHRRLDTFEIFYVGIGKRKNRIRSKYSRNIYWHNIVNKTDYIAEILAENLSWEDACELEIFLIEEYGRKKDGGKLCNITIGGDGAKGFSHTEKYKLNLSNRMMGNILSQETKDKISKAHMGKTYSEATKLKMSNYWTGKISNNAKKIIDISTEIVYSSIKEAAESIGMKKSTLNAKLTGQNKNDTNFRYLNDAD